MSSVWLALFLPIWFLSPTFSTPLLAHAPGHLSLAVPPRKSPLSTTQPGVSASWNHWPPEGFTIRVSGGTKPIGSLSVFHLSFKALVDLAEASPRRPYPAQVIRLPENNAIALSIDGPSDELYNSQYYIWGLTLATRYMVDHSFRDWRFELHWANRVVGRLWYLNTHESRVHDANGGTTTGHSLSNWTDVAVSQSAATAVLPNIRIMPSVGEFLTLNEVMMVIINAFADYAPRDIDATIRGICCFIFARPYRGQLTIELYYPRVLDTHWDTYRLLIKILVALASWYSAEELQWPAAIDIEFDGVPIAGRGFLDI
ncbi:MAG: hypothetical protein Q9168_004499 [Polycauliona sp. 1 TL-2023]